MPRSTRRGPWLPDEDRTLLQLVHLQGPNNWVRISQHMEHRSPKQCRERYHQNLKPNLNHDPISSEEGDAIEQLVQDMGKRWAEIARRLGNRSDNAVKNWWNGSLNRRKRHHIPHTSSRGVGPRALPVPATDPHLSEREHGQHFNSINASRHHLPAYQGLHRGHHLQTDKPAEQSINDVLALPSVDVDPKRRSFSLPQPYLPRPELRGPPNFLEAHSAPPSSTTSPHPHVPPARQVSPDQQRLRPPHLESRHSYPSQWSSSSRTQLDYPAISPAASEFSTLPSAHQAPSLISDNQSHYSISPKTVSSPRPTLPAPIDTSNARIWYSDQGRNSFVQFAPETKYPLADEGYVSALPASTSNDKVGRRSALDLNFDRQSPPRQATTPVESRIQGMSASSPIERDSRMNVARLLD